MVPVEAHLTTFVPVPSPARPVVEPLRKNQLGGQGSGKLNEPFRPY